LVGAAGTADGRLEAAIRGDGVVGQDAAIAPAADRQSITVRNAPTDQVVDTGQQVLHFLVAPIGNDGLRICGAAAAAATIVDPQHHVALRRE